MLNTETVDGRANSDANVLAFNFVLYFREQLLSDAKEFPLSFRFPEMTEDLVDVGVFSSKDIKDEVSVFGTFFKDNESV